MVTQVTILILGRKPSNPVRLTLSVQYVLHKLQFCTGTAGTGNGGTAVCILYVCMIGELRTIDYGFREVVK